MNPKASAPVRTHANGAAAGGSAHPEAYTTNATLEEIAARLASASRIALLTHSKPDGDAVGSTLAIARALTSMGKVAVPVYLPPWQAKFDGIIGPTPVIHEHHGCWHQPPLIEIDCVAVVDTGSWNQVADARPWLTPRREHTVIIDHHAHGDAEIASMRHVDVSAAAACQLAATVCALLLRVSTASRLPADIATPLYLGIATDTGWFRHSNVRASTLRLAADLIDAGVDHNAIYRHVEQSEPPARLWLVRRALENMKLELGDRVAIITISKAEAEACKAGPEELGGLTDLPQTIGSVRVAAVITEPEPGIAKVSLRSKAADPGQPEIDVNRVAQSFGGGGHFHAAGAKLHASLSDARQRVLTALAGVLP